MVISSSLSYGEVAGRLRDNLLQTSARARQQNSPGLQGLPLDILVKESFVRFGEIAWFTVIRIVDITENTKLLDIWF